MVQRTHEYGNTVTDILHTHTHQSETRIWYKITLPGAEKLLPLIVFVRKAMREQYELFTWMHMVHLINRDHESETRAW